MSNQVQYIQCVLKRNNTIQTSWIPERFAVIGKYLKLMENDEWQNGWQVMSRGVKISKDMLTILAEAHKKTRKASDI